MHRRAILSAIAAATLMPGAVARAQTGVAAKSLEATLLGMAALMDATASAIAGFAADLARLDPSRAPSRERARAASDGIVEAYLEVNRLYIRQTTETAPALDAFAADPTPGQWKEAKDRIAATIAAIDRVQRTLDLQGDAFAVSPLHAELQLNLAARSAALSRLDDLPPPKTAAELSAYRRMVRSYRGLLVRMEGLRDALRAYAQSAVAAP